MPAVPSCDEAVLRPLAERRGDDRLQPHRVAAPRLRGGELPDGPDGRDRRVAPPGCCEARAPTSPGSGPAVLDFRVLQCRGPRREPESQSRPSPARLACRASGRRSAPPGVPSASSTIAVPSAATAGLRPNPDAVDRRGRSMRERGDRLEGNREAFGGRRLIDRHRRDPASGSGSASTDRAHRRWSSRPLALSHVASTRASASRGAVPSLARTWNAGPSDTTSSVRLPSFSRRAARTMPPRFDEPVGVDTVPAGIPGQRGVGGRKGALAEVRDVRGVDDRGGSRRVP